MRKITKKEKILVSATSATIGMAVIVIAVTMLGSNVVARDNVIFGGLTIAFSLPAAIDYIEYRWKKSVEEKFPDFLREMAERLRSGMSFYKALEAAAKRDYGPLTEELKILIYQISWGAKPEEAFQAFAKRIGTPLARRVSILLLEVGKMGAKTAMVLETIGDFLRSIQLIEKEKTAELRIHMLTIYTAFLTFMIISAILVTKFFYPLYFSIAEYAGALKPLMTPIEARQLLLHMLSIEAITSGLMAGKISEKRISAGLKHAIILLAISLIIYNYLVKPI